MNRTVFITGGTGYIGSNLIPALLIRGHAVRALVRDGSRGKIPRSCTLVTGDALDKSTFCRSIAPADTFVQLVGVPHANPSKADAFRQIDLVSARASVEAAKESGVAHFIYVSVAHPAPMMQAYIDVRKECEELIARSGMHATVLRPWYVLGEGHRWPVAIAPIYWILEALPGTRDSARRLGLLKLTQMISAMVHVVEHPPTGVRILDVVGIKLLTKG